MKVKTGEFSKDVKELSYDRIPLLDKKSLLINKFIIFAGKNKEELR